MSEKNTSQIDEDNDDKVVESDDVTVGAVVVVVVVVVRSQLRTDDGSDSIGGCKDDLCSFDTLPSTSASARDCR